ncbi:MAG: MFS transporter [Armatimonadetes bacterium]|nr:MFS transporter [Armatimonadota bacterium]
MDSQTQMEQATATATRRPRGVAVVVLLAVSLSCYLAGIPVFAPRLQEHFSITNRELGTLLSCQAIGGLVGFVSVLPLAGALGMRRAASISAAATGAGYAAAGLASSLLGLEVSFFVIGVFAGALFVSAMALLVELFPEWKRRMVAIMLATTSAPLIVFPVLAQWALVHLVDGGRVSLRVVVQGPLVVIGAVLASAGVTIWVTRLREGPRQSDVTPVRWRELVTLRTLVIFFLAALHGGADTGVYSWLPKHMTSSFTSLPVPPGVVLSVCSVCYLVARLLQASIPEKRAQRAFLTVTGPLGGFIFLAGLWSGNPLAVAVAYPLAGAAWCLEFPALLAEITSGRSAEFGGVVAGTQVASFLGTIAQLNLVGWIADQTGSFRLALTVPAVSFVAFGLIAGLTLARRPTIAAFS